MREVDTLGIREVNVKRGKTTISNEGISKRVFRKPLGAPAGLGYPWAPGRIRVVDGQVGQVRLG